LKYRITASNWSYMSMEFGSRLQTEIDYINGALAHEGARAGVLCPLNSVIARIVHVLESVL
jgi:ketopantoate reductase